MGEWIVVIFAGVSVGLLCGAFVPFMLMPSPNELLRRKHEFLRRKYEEEKKGGQNG